MDDGDITYNVECDAFGNGDWDPIASETGYSDLDAAFAARDRWAAQAEADGSTSQYRVVKIERTTTIENKVVRLDGKMDEDELPNKPENWHVLWSAKTNESLLWTEEVMQEFDVVEWHEALSWAVKNTEERLRNHVCPECRQGKCVNCTEDLLNDNDELVPCRCESQVHQ